jgi:predicted aspartyl protease
LNQNPDLTTSQEGQSSVQSTLQTNVIATGRSTNEVYLCGEFNGQKITCLLDTGCDMSVIGSRLLPNLSLEPTQHRLLAANHTAIPVVGDTTITFSVSGKQFSVRVVVSDIMEDLILGIDWLRKYRCRWDFGKNLIEIDGCAVRLHGRSQQNQLRRIYVAEDTLLPARQQQEVRVIITLPTLREISRNWITEPRTVESGVTTASTLISSNMTLSRIPVVNSTKEERFFQGSQLLSVAIIDTDIITEAAEEKELVHETDINVKNLCTIINEDRETENDRGEYQHLLPVME